MEDSPEAAPPIGGERLNRQKLSGGKSILGRKKRVAENKGKNKKAKTKARDLRRLLLKKKDVLPPEVVARMEEQISALDREAVQDKKSEKRKRFVVKRKQLYDKLKFYEGQKVRRKIKAERRTLSDLLRRRRDAVDDGPEEIHSLDASIEEHQAALRKHLDDLNYILRYPADEPYIALFPSGGPVSEETEKKREAMRAKIRQQMLQERIEDDGDDDAEGGEEDAFFLAEKPAGPPVPTSTTFESDGSDAAEDEAVEHDVADPFAEAPDWADQDEQGRKRGWQGRRGTSRGGPADRKRERSSHEHSFHEADAQKRSRHDAHDAIRRGGKGGRGGSFPQRGQSRDQTRGGEEEGRRNPRFAARGRGKGGSGLGSARERSAEAKESGEGSADRRNREGPNHRDRERPRFQKEGGARGEDAGKQAGHIGLSKKYAGATGKHTVFESDSE
ncbi:hypothetical protein BESB_045380 [Besnoitia besnoiti]|uniref:rRNA-processing protein EFG1 n=1 Tax=Besnoitia besnoiti TaxID=94643 RepID=A0A2A9MK52_BESBE|nr:hypothetical protein BESB_045380 [Besnoitia besnoiti]PFH36346.1 hypothetical protein BESB_045380 [Besnoitia besnoiti]